MPAFMYVPKCPTCNALCGSVETKDDILEFQSPKIIRCHNCGKTFTALRDDEDEESENVQAINVTGMKFN